MAWQQVGRFSNDVWRLDLDNGVSLIAKVPFRPPQATDPADVERLFYPTIRTLAADRALPLPLWVGEIDGVLLLEYQPLVPFSFASGATRTHAEAAVLALADWHAHWWDNPPRLDWLTDTGDPSYLAIRAASFETAWRHNAELLTGYAPDFRPLGDRLIGRLAGSLADEPPPHTLLHGDAHAENLPLTDTGKVLMLDWQDPGIGNPGYDLAVFMTLSFRERDRPARERALLPLYLQRLEGHGLRWSDPWLGYRYGLLRRVARLIELAEAGFPSLPWVFRRAANAALDHNVGALIR